MARRLHAPWLRCCVQPVIANSAQRATSVRLLDLADLGI